MNWELTEFIGNIISTLRDAQNLNKTQHALSTRQGGLKAHVLTKPRMPNSARNMALQAAFEIMNDGDNQEENDRDLKDTRTSEDKPRKGSRIRVQ